MQDRYVGDIGDYGKLILLRHLNQCALGRLAIVWHTVGGSAEKNNDGSIRNYRSYSGVHCLKHCDPVLFDGFARFENLGDRKIEHLQTFVDALYFGEHVSCGDRRTWTENALKATENGDIVFFDPDDGIATDANGSSRKHVYLDELRAFWHRGQSLIVYHHLSRRKGGHAFELRELEARLKSNLTGATTYSVHFRRGTSRVLINVIQKGHLEKLESALRERVPWRPLTQTKAEWAREVHRSRLESPIR